jgi:Carboxypeptidase regulatory-like domain
MGGSHCFKGGGVYRSLLAIPVACASLFIIFTMPPVWGQATSTATIGGQVTDPSGAAIPGAEVTLTDMDTQVTRTALSNEAGRYIFVNVPSGNYKVKVTMPGFATSESSGWKATVGSALNIDVSLKIGSHTETVVVEAGGIAELVTTSAAVGSTISGNSLLHLPNFGRDVSTLAVLQPGVASSGYTAGSYMDQNTYILDGGNTSDDMAGNTTGYQTNFTGLGGTQTGGFVSGVVPTPVESIEEVRVSVFNQGADFNNSTGGSIQMVTKRGTNDFHGAAYMYYFATNIGAANNWQNNHTPSGGLSYTPLPKNHRSRFGAALGGPLLPKEVLGGKWYFFFNYEGMRYPNVSNYERLVPSALMRAGVIQVPNSSGTYVPYNLNAKPVTVNGVTYQPAACPNSANGLCDPRGIGLNPIVNQLWSKYMPLPNDPNWGTGDTYNTQGYLSTIRAPLTSNNYVSRIDHQFGDKFHFMMSYRYLRLINMTTNQVDIGGALPGNTLGTPTATAPRPQIDGYIVAGLTATISPHVTNDFRFVYLRQFWQWGSAQAPPQLPGLGGAIEIGAGNASSGESGNALIPYNVNTQSIRLRFWDGQDKSVIDNLTMLKGNHVYQFGGSYQRNYNYHMRTDNGIGQNNQIVYWLGDFGQLNFTNSPYIPSTVPSSQYSNYKNLYGEVLGIVPQSQVVYTRAGQDLTLQPIGSVAFNQSIIPYYNFYFSDTWKLKPTLTLTYGLAYALEMPPYELNGKQVALVDQNNQLINYEDYIAQRQKAALAGQVYNPLIGFSTVRNVGKGLKYPYDPFYGGLSPRVAVAWNPHYSDGILGKLFGNGNTVIRGGYGRIWGRINGVLQVLTPMLGPGMLQPVICNGGTMTGQCLGNGQATPVNAFRIGVDGMTAPLPSAGQTLAQPFVTGGTNPNAGDSTLLDPHTKPSRTDNFSFSIQHQFSHRLMLEVGYMGRKSSNISQMINLDAVPYMTTLGGQTFAKAFVNLYTHLCGGAYPCPSTATAASVPVQPFFEAALGGASSSYCSKFSSCTVAFATNNTSNIKNASVSLLWGALDRAWTLGRSMLSSSLNGGFNQAASMTLDASVGWSNYNAMYVSFKTNDWHGLTAASHFTWSRALGLGELAQYNSSATTLTPFNLSASYGTQGYDIKFIYNASMYYQPQFFKGMHGIKGKLLGGWTIAPLFTAQSGAVIAAGYSPASPLQAFGESSSSSVSATTENAVFAKPYTGGNTTHLNVTGSSGIGTNNPYGVNMFSDPAAIYSQFRPCILGIDTSCGSYGNLRGLPRWNLDASLSKDFGIIGERVGATLTLMFTNVMNHNVMSNPSLSLTSPTTFGRITSQANTPRNMEFGLRIHF